jgi:hypothetical protein
MTQFSNTVKSLISANKTKAALAILADYYRDKDTDLHNQCLMQQSALVETEKNLTMSILSRNDAVQSLAKVRYAAITLADEIDKTLENDAEAHQRALEIEQLFKEPELNLPTAANPKRLYWVLGLGVLALIAAFALFYNIQNATKAPIENGQTPGVSVEQNSNPTTINPANPNTPQVVEPPVLKEFEVSFKGITISRTDGNGSAIAEGIRNGDCKRVYGTIRAEVWELDGSGNRVKQIPAFKNDLTPAPSDGMLLYWSNEGNNTPVKSEVLNYAQSGSLIGNTSWRYKLDAASVSSNRVELIIYVNLGSCHKSGDFSSDFSPNMSMHGEKSNNIYFKDPGNGIEVGPFRADDPAKTSEVHDFRAHFDIRQL